MGKQIVISLLKGNTLKNDMYVGELAEITVDTEAKNLRLHDNITPGGVKVLNESQVNALVSTKANATHEHNDIYYQKNEVDLLLQNHSTAFDENGTYINLRAQATTKADVGLGNVDNTSDLEKTLSGPIKDAIDNAASTGGSVEIIDNLTDISVDKALSANQGTVLKDYIDNIISMLASDDVSLDELQEIVTYIKQNRDTLNALSITNIAGLETALNNKVDKITGKGLSTEDFTTEEKTKLANLDEAPTNVNRIRSGILGESCLLGDLVILKSDGLWWKSIANNVSDVKGCLGIVLETKNVGEVTTLLLNGEFNTTGLTISDEYYVSVSVAGEFNNVKSELAGTIVRSIGYALSSTTLLFSPSNSFIEILP